MSFTRFSNGGSSSSFSRFNQNPYDTTSIDKQVNNANTRIQDAGFKPQDGDSRNWFEKATNLPQHQNAFFDTLELLGRPGNAVKNVLHKATGANAVESVGEALYKGISGKEKVNGIDLIDKQGDIKNGFARFLAGTGVDIITDPLSFVPGGVIADGVKAAVKPIGALAKTAYNAAEKIPSFARFSENTIKPAVENVKDGLGYAFNPNYKIDETLSGGKSDVLKNASQQTDNSRAFMQEEAMKNVSNAAVKAGGIDTGVDVGRVMEAPLRQFEDIHVNDLKVGDLAIPTTADGADLSAAKMIEDIQNKDGMNYFKFEGSNTYMPENMVKTEPREIPRQRTDIPTDPKIQESAKTLTELNSTIRQYAEDNGIAIPEMEGYMTHVFSQAERDARKINKPINVDSGSFGQGNPNKSILKQRELMGSAEEINTRLGKNKFEPNAYFATAIGQKRLIDYIHAVKLRKDVLDNTDFAQKFIKGMDVPRNAEVIDSNNYKFLKDSGDSLDGIVSTETIGGQYIVTKQAKMILDRYQKLNTDEGTKAFLKAFDGIQSLWKKGALFSIGYHVRNQAGAMFNNYVAGMNPYDLVKYTKEGFEEVAKSVGGKETEMFTEFRKQGLGSSTLSQVEYAKTGQQPEEAIQKTVENMSKTTGEKVKQRLNPLNGFQTSAELGNFFDQANRFSLYKWARSKGMSAEEAAQKVRDVQFDYSKTTPFEKNIATRVFPFYRWMRNNIPFQIKSFINDPRKYEFLNKGRLNAQEAVGLNEDNVPDYMKQSFSLPLYGKNGKGKFLGLNLPLTDLTKLSQPGKTLVDSVTPLLKTLAELATNFNTFRGKAIQKFQGQKQQYQIPYTDIGFGVPIKTGYALDQMTGQIGRGLSGFLQKQQDQDIVNRLPSLGISSLAKPFDAEKYAYYARLDDLKQAQDLMLYIQQQTGNKPRTLTQIKKGN